MRINMTRNRLLAAVAAGLVFAASTAFADDDHETKEAWRLFVADHTQPVVRAIDLDSGKELGRYDLKGYAALTASATGRTVFAVQGEADVIHVIGTGIDFSDHGDHRDLKVSDPALLPSNWRAAATPDDRQRYARQVCDFIAGMTDRYALDQHKHLFDLDPLFR